MNFLETLSEIGLRRLYKFVIKSLIGRYLVDELLIEQLSVSYRDGLVSLKDLAIDCDVINKEILNDDIPFKFQSINISCLEAVLSYKVLLADGCRFTIHDVDVVIVPLLESDRSHNKATESKSMEYSTDSNKKNDKVDTNTKSNDQMNGVEYVARWIDIIIASLNVKINKIKIIIQNPDNLSNKPMSDKIEINIHDINYYNSHPNLMKLSSDTSASLSNKSMSYVKSSKLNVTSNLKVS